MHILIFIATLLVSVSAHAAEEVLCSELSIDPLGRGYAGMTVEAQAADLNSNYRTIWKECVEGRDLLDSIELADWNSITDAQRDRVLLLLGIGCLDPQGNARQLMIRIFGSGSDTIANMVSVAQENISRAAELGLSKVKPAHISECP